MTQGSDTPHSNVADPEPKTNAGDPVGSGRTRGRPGYWMLGLQMAEAGELLSPESHARVFEMLPEDGKAVHTPNARGEVALLVSIPEEQLDAFAEGDWRVGHRMDGADRLVLLLVVGSDEPLEVPFDFNLTNPEVAREASQLSELEELDFYGVTHMEEGVMLTLKGSVDLPDAFRAEVLADLRRSRWGGPG